jgi:hypothetical protein
LRAELALERGSVLPANNQRARRAHWQRPVPLVRHAQTADLRGDANRLTNRLRALMLTH